MDIDETCCGALCQHPSCWDSQRRLVRGIPHVGPRVRPPSPEDQGLPSQAIVNLLAGYGEDPYDRYPVSQSSKSSHRRSNTTSPYTRPTTRESYPKMKVPTGTPASFLQSSTNSGLKNTNIVFPGEPTKPKKLNKLEVQEVFDLNDLKSDWHDTFVPQQCYIWVPNQKKPKRKQQPEPPKIEGLKVGEMGESTASVVPKDLTEFMVPREVEWQRANTKMRRVKSPKTPQHGIPFTPYSGKSPDNYYGIYELLDLPKDVLIKVLDHIDRRDLMDRERLAVALARAFPKLERDNSSLAMAYGDVLMQTKIRPSDIPNKPHRGPAEPIPTKQIFLMDTDYSLHAHHTRGGPAAPPPHRPLELHIPLTPNPPPNLQRNLTPSPLPESATRVAAQQSVNQMIKKQPLPAIPAAPQGEDSSERPKIKTISLGLPVIPSGVKFTKPFTYEKGQDLDLALGPVTTPSPQPLESVQEPGTTTQNLSSERSSTVHVTMPTVPTETMDQRMGSPVSKLSPPASHYDLPHYNTICTTWDAGEAMSPPYSTYVPKTPNATPAVWSHPGTGSSQQNRTPSPVKQGDRAGNMIPAAVILPQVPMSPEPTGVLDTIRESEQGEAAESRTELPKSRRSVRFASDMPRQPPSSPNSSERSMSPITGPKGRFVLGAESTMNNYEVSTQPDILTIQRDGTSSREITLPLSGDTMLTTSGMTPEPWPTVDEEAYKRMSPLPLSEADAAGLEAKSEPPSGYTSMGESRESSFHSAKMAALREAVEESPGPPPPSPEPKDGRSNNISVGDGIKLDTSFNLEDLIETDSEYTLSAKPPSNLDDISRIQTPAYTPQVELQHENTNLSTGIAASLAMVSAETVEKPDKVPDPKLEAEGTLTGIPEEGKEPHHPPTVDILIIPETRPTSEAEELENKPKGSTLPDQQNDPLGGTTNQDSGLECTDEQKSSPKEETELPPDNHTTAPIDANDPPNAINPQNPGYPQSFAADEAGRPVSGMSKDGTSQLDQFDTTEDMFKEELQEELERLAQDVSKEKDGSPVGDTSADSDAKL